MIAQTVLALTKMKIGWSMDEVLADLLSRNFQLVQSAGKRRTFVDQHQKKYSFYFREDGRIRSVESTVEVFLDVDALSEDDYQHVLADYQNRYDVSQNEVVSLLGAGREYSLAAADGFPHERDAIRLTLWKLPGADLMLELKHEGSDAPIRIVLTLAPSEP